MDVSRTTTNWPTWAQSPAGRYLLEWEQTQLDQEVEDIFGYHALQVGLPELDVLRKNRIPCRSILLDPRHFSTQSASRQPAIICDLPELPFETQSIDLIVLPHTLELTQFPHILLREAERVLLPEGKLVILGFNSLSLWGVRQSLSRLFGRGFLPIEHDLTAFSRLKDWMKLLGLELNRGRFGCYSPPLQHKASLQRCNFMEAAGERWWPILGAVYMITAIKRVRNMRLITPKRTNNLRKPRIAPSPSFATTTDLTSHPSQTKQK